MTSNAARLTLLTMAAVMLLVWAPLGAVERLTTRVAPRVAIAPATVVIDAVAERDAANRALQIQVDSLSSHRL